jgi:adenylate kinase family enzyme
MAMKKKNIANAIILGSSSSGKTSVAQYLAKKYHGVCISLDGVTASGRPLTSVLHNANPKQFNKEELGVIIRKVMITEAEQAHDKNIPWFMEDVDTFLINALPLKLRKNTRIVTIIPTLPKLVENILGRNKKAKVASEEREVIPVLKQYRRFLFIKHFDKKPILKDGVIINHFVISNKELIEAAENDKMYYSVSNKSEWEESVNSILNLYGFKPLKSKKISYAEVYPLNIHAHISVICDSSLIKLCNLVENYLINHYTP